jgi:hypothetical protein
VEQASIPYLLIGAAAAAERRARRAAPAAIQTTRTVLWPAAKLYESPPLRGVRLRTAASSASFVREGRELTDALLSRDVLKQRLRAAINSPATDELLQELLDSAALDRLTARVLDSSFVENLTIRVIASDEMDLVLDYVTNSPEVRAAVTRQTAGLAGDMAAGVRSRTAVGDATTERLAQHIIRRLRSPVAS